MGNANGKEDDGDHPSAARILHRPPSSDSMNSSPPASPARSPSPFLFPPQLTFLFHVTSFICPPTRHLFHCLGITCVPNGCISCQMVPMTPLQRPNGPPSPNNIQWNQTQRVVDVPAEQGIPTIITWNQGGNEVAVEGSWDNWRSRKKLQKSGKDHSILIVLPSGIYHYKVIVDGESKYFPDLPFVSDEMGNICNILDVNNFEPENPESIVEFEAPPSPDHSYSQNFPAAEDYTKDPLGMPPQLHLTLVGSSEESTGIATKPQHVMLNHVFIEQGWAPQPIVALGLTHRFQSKYITVVLYKPLTR